MRLQDKVVVVTGASKGIGRATALAFSQEGAKVVLASRNVKLLKDLAKDLSGEYLIVKTDVSSEKDVKNLFQKTVKAFGAVDILVNNAGTAGYYLVKDMSLEEWRSILEPNLTGVFLCSREGVQAGVNHIITVSSILAFYSLPLRGAYCASKHGVSGLMNSLKKELKGKVRVDTIHPAGVDTAILADMSIPRKKWMMLRSEDLAAFILALASQNFFRIAGVRKLNILRRFYFIVKYFGKNPSN